MLERRYSRRLRPFIREEQLLHETQILKKRLYRRDIQLPNMIDILQCLKNTGNSSDELEEILLKVFWLKVRHITK